MSFQPGAFEPTGFYVFERVRRDSSLSWPVRGRVAAAASVRWSVRQRAVAATTIAWRMDGALAPARGHRIKVELPPEVRRVRSDAALSWRLRKRLSSTASLGWTVAAVEPPSSPALDLNYLAAVYDLDAELAALMLNEVAHGRR